MHWNHPHEAAVRVITEGLVELGILRGVVEELIEKESYKSITCIEPVIGWAWTYMMWVTTKLAGMARAGAQYGVDHRAGNLYRAQ